MVCVKKLKEAETEAGCLVRICCVHVGCKAGLLYLEKPVMQRCPPLDINRN